MVPDINHRGKTKLEKRKGRKRKASIENNNDTKYTKMELSSSMLSGISKDIFERIRIRCKSNKVRVNTNWINLLLLRSGAISEAIVRMKSIEFKTESSRICGK